MRLCHIRNGTGSSICVLISTGVGWSGRIAMQTGVSHCFTSSHIGLTIRWSSERIVCSFNSKSPSCPASRSEEHTSELQSRQYLVCRLLLEKKKNHNLEKQP